MGERVRGALFNTLGDIDGLTVLDAFAGSGALGFEAISRGAKEATLIEPDKSAHRAIVDNISQLGVSGQTKLINAKAGSWLSTASRHFDIVLCDPPYDGVNNQLLAGLAERAVPGGTIVISLPPGRTVELPQAYRPVRKKEFGDATLHFYRKMS
jgi:16S rRNA (guanine966-N2)-methyltransferase